MQMILLLLMNRWFSWHNLSLMISFPSPRLILLALHRKCWLQSWLVIYYPGKAFLLLVSVIYHLFKLCCNYNSDDMQFWRSKWEWEKFRLQGPSRPLASCQWKTRQTISTAWWRVRMWLWHLLCSTATLYLLRNSKGSNHISTLSQGSRGKDISFV